QNGLSFLKDIRAEPELANIPVIMMTTAGQTDVVQAAILLGANDFITKPFDLKNLIERVTRLAPLPVAEPDVIEEVEEEEEK
ncbi:MAG TPA: response regulator, partial [Leptolinea sp.]